VRYARLRAQSPTYGAVTVVIVDEPGQDRFYLLCLETTMSAPQLIRRWRRRNWIEFVFRTLKHLLATEACQVSSEDAYYGHLVLRLMASFVLFYLPFYHLSSFRCSDLGCWVYYENILPSPSRSEHRPSIPCGGSRA
jgi:hypothetical protein